MTVSSISNTIKQISKLIKKPEQNLSRIFFYFIIIYLLYNLLYNLLYKTYFLILIDTRIFL